MNDDVMIWGFYCRTCGTSSQGWYEEFTSLLRLFREYQDAAMAGARAGECETGAHTFLARHSGHEIWAESENGVLRLSRKAEPPAGDTSLPHRFISANRSRR